MIILFIAILLFIRTIVTGQISISLVDLIFEHQMTELHNCTTLEELEEVDNKCIQFEDIRPYLIILFDMTAWRTKDGISKEKWEVLKQYGKRKNIR